MVGVLAASLGSFYGFGLMSATDLGLTIVSVDRRYNPSPPNVFLQYDLELLVSGRASLTTFVVNPTFDLHVNGIDIGQATPPQRSFGPNSAVGYLLKFATTNPSDAAVLASEANSTLTVTLASITASGLYSGFNRASTKGLFSFGPALVTLAGPVRFPGSFNSTSCFCFVDFYDGFVHRNATIKAPTPAPSTSASTVGRYSILIPNYTAYSVTVWTAPLKAPARSICDAGPLTVSTQNLYPYASISC